MENSLEHCEEILNQECQFPPKVFLLNKVIASHMSLVFVIFISIYLFVEFNLIFYFGINDFFFGFKCVPPSFKIGF